MWIVWRMRSATQCAVWLEDQGGIGATEYVGFRRDGFSASNGSSPLSVSQNRTVRTRPRTRLFTSGSDYNGVWKAYRKLKDPTI